MSTNDRIAEIFQKHYSDPIKKKILNDFFEEMMSIGDISKSVIRTSHGDFYVVDGKPGKAPEASAKFNALWNQGDYEGAMLALTRDLERRVGTLEQWTKNK